MIVIILQCKMSIIKVTEERVLYAATAGAVLGVILMIVSVSTDHWVIVTIPGGVYINASKSYLLNHHSGLWRICRHELKNGTNEPRVESE